MTPLQGGNLMKWSRRNFISSRGLGASAGGLIGAILPEPKKRAMTEKTLAHWCIARRAMACEFSIYLPPTIGDVLTAAEAALGEIETMENVLTVYSGSSDMSYVNQHAASGAVRVDDRLFQILKRAKALTEQTGGAFDVAAGALVKAWGFFRGPKRVPDEGERLAALARTGMQHVELDETDRTVRYDVAGLEINLGAIGKGYAIDRAIGRMKRDFGVDCALMQGGSSSVYGLGSPTRDDRGWLVGIQNPYDSGQHLATVRLRDRALGTSGTANQYFEYAGQRYGHILDPRTGRPADELAAVSVLAPDAATADALSTALFVMGLDKATVFCHDHAEIAALIVLKPESSSGTNGLPRVLTFNLSAQDVELYPDLLASPD
jgi:FAD:protein FMN transferase